MNKDNYLEHGNIIIMLLLLPLGHISNTTFIIATVSIDVVNMFRLTTWFTASIMLMAFSTTNFILGSGLYVRDKGSQTIFFGMSVAFLVAIKKWRIRSVLGGLADAVSAVITDDDGVHTF